MCTVTYYPYKNNFIITSNRDEHYKRKASLKPKIYEVNEKNLLFPKDQEAGGTWIAASKNRVATILNGAFDRHKHEPPYERSRGLVLLDSFKFDIIEDFVNKYDFKGIEPFTYISFEKKEHIVITEIRWDEEEVFVRNLDSKSPQLWRSATLYTKDDELKKQDKYLRLCSTQELSDSQLLEFHLLDGKIEDNNDIILNRTSFGVQTTATTQIIFGNENVSMKYLNHLSNEKSSSKLTREI